MKKIRILHIIKSLGRGGAEMLLPETLALHDQSKFEFHYIYFLPWKDQMVQAIEEQGGIVNCFEAKNNIQLIGQYPKIADYCHSHQIDLIHCHLPWAGFVGRLVHRKTRIPMVYTEHNMQERYHPVTKFLNKKSFNSQSLAVGVSEDVSQSIKNNISPSIPVRTILNGVNTQKFSRNNHDLSVREHYNIPENAIVIGLVSVFRFQKRIKEWLQVFRNLKDSSSEEIFGLIVGAGPLEEEIMQEVERLNLRESVIFTGLQENTLPYFNAMDIFMMSSSFEGLPIALLEAMSMECAIVTTNAGGIKEVVRDEKDGLMVPVEEWEELKERLKSLITDRSRLTELQKAARERVITEFSLQVMTKNLEQAYMEFSE